jgi:TATA-binding protein-associated factor
MVWNTYFANIVCLQAVDWPFENFCDQLCQDLFSPSWEVRHGAATALREVVRVHGGGAGKAADQTETEVPHTHKISLCP